MKHLTTENFPAFIQGAPVLVDFWATWCGPCQMEGKVLEKICQDYPQYAERIGKVNVDEARELAISYGIQAIPSLLFFANGKVTQTIVGARGEEELLVLLKQAFA